MTKLRLLSNNIWNCDTNKSAWEEKGEDCSAEARMPGIARVYAELRPDIIGLQEASHKMVDCLMTELGKLGLRYAVHWTRFTSVLYRPELFELVDSEYLCYPTEFPPYEGSFNDVRSKSCNLAVFRVKESSKIFIFANTHLWWRNRNPNAKSYQPGSGEARAHQVQLASALIDKYREKYHFPAVLLGDMNDTYDSPMMAAAHACGFTHAHDVAVEYACQENGYHYCFPDGHKPYAPRPFVYAIDHIWVKGFEKNAVRRFERYTPDYYEALSDHYPAFVDIEL